MAIRVSIPSRRAVVAGASAIAFASAAVAQQPADSAQIVVLMESYAAALRSNNVEALVAMYTPNGVFIRENMQAVVGRDALGAAYREIFATLKVDLHFTFHEIEVAGDMAWLRATSSGRIKILATGVESADGFNLMVVFRREGNAWKIRSYLYASNLPGPGPAK